MSTAKASKYAPAREDGLKPFHVALTSWGRSWGVIVYAETASDAEYRAKHQQMHTYAKARRATPADMENTHVEDDQ